jgi:hypothetical protein
MPDPQRYPYCAAASGTAGADLRPGHNCYIFRGMNRGRPILELRQPPPPPQKTRAQIEAAKARRRAMAEQLRKTVARTAIARQRDRFGLETERGSSDMETGDALNEGQRLTEGDYLQADPTSHAHHDYQTERIVGPAYPGDR